MWNDNPFYVLDAPWSSKEQRQAAGTFLDFLMTESIQKQSLAHGFRRGKPGDLNQGAGQSLRSARTFRVAGRSGDVMRHTRRSGHFESSRELATRCRPMMRQAAGPLPRRPLIHHSSTQGGVPPSRSRSRAGRRPVQSRGGSRVSASSALRIPVSGSLEPASKHFTSPPWRRIHGFSVGHGLRA